MAIIILDPNEEFAHTHATESRSQCLRGEVSVTLMASHARSASAKRR